MTPHRVTGVLGRIYLVALDFIHDRYAHSNTNSTSMGSVQPHIPISARKQDNPNRDRLLWGSGAVSLCCASTKEDDIRKYDI